MNYDIQNPNYIRSNPKNYERKILVSSFRLLLNRICNPIPVPAIRPCWRIPHKILCTDRIDNTGHTKNCLNITPIFRRKWCTIKICSSFQRILHRVSDVPTENCPRLVTDRLSICVETQQLKLASLNGRSPPSAMSDPVADRHNSWNRCVDDGTFRRILITRCMTV